MLRYLFASILIVGCAQPTTHRPAVTLPELQEEITVQVKEEFRQQMQRHERIERIKNRIILANLSLCNEKKSDYWFAYIDRAGLQDLNIVSQTLFLDYIGLEWMGDYPIVYKVLDPEQEELKAGDKILEIRGQSVQAKYQPKIVEKTFMGPRRTVKGRWINTIDLALKGAPKLGKIPIKVQRQIEYIDANDRDPKPTYRDTILEVSMGQREVCFNHSFHIEKSEINAFTDGSNIFITTGMLKFATDEELALVIAHELAHCFETHVDKKRANSVLGQLVGTFFDVMVGRTFGDQTDEYSRAGAQIGAGAFSQPFELEADYVGLYLLARAGYPTKDAAAFWRKMAARAPLASNTFTGTHPPSAERYLLLEKTHKEIEEKRAKGQPLLPNRALSRLQKVR